MVKDIIDDLMTNNSFDVYDMPIVRSSESVFPDCLKVGVVVVPIYKKEILTILQTVVQ